MTSAADKTSAILLASVGALFTGFLGFVLGVAQDSNAQYMERADECYSALDGFAISLIDYAPNVVIAATLDKSAPERPAALKFVNDMIAAYSTAQNKCPLTGDPEYLSPASINSLVEKGQYLNGCVVVVCEGEALNRTVYELIRVATDLKDQANEVHRWGIGKQAVETSRRFF